MIIHRHPKYQGPEVTLHPRRNCNHCLGRGYSGTRLDGTKVMCRCVTRPAAVRATLGGADMAKSKNKPVKKTTKKDCK